MRKNKIKILSILFAALFTGCFEFIPDTLQVVGWSPANHERGVEPGAVFEMSFSAEPDRSDLEDSFNMYNTERSVDGRFEWVSKTSFRFIPSEPLLKNGRYVVHVPRSLRDTKGSTMGSDFISDFYVGDDFVLPEVTGSTPPFAAGAVSGVAVTLNPAVSFSKSMNRESVEKAFRLRPDSPGYFEWSESMPGLLYSRLEYVLFNPMTQGQLYTLTVADSASDYAGNKLKSTYLVNFIAGGPAQLPLITGVYDSDNTDAPPWNAGTINSGIEKNIRIAVEFSEPMDRLSVENSFSVTPGVSGIFEWIGDRKLIFRPVSHYDSERRYQLRIDGGAKSVYGFKMGEPAVFEFIVNGADSLFIRYSRIEGSNDSDIFTLLCEAPGDSAVWPLQIDMGGGVNQSYYFKINFVSGSKPAEMQQYTIYDNYLIETFKSGSRGSVDNAVVSDIRWTGPSEALIKISGMTNRAVESHPNPYLYRLSIKGGAGGLKDKNNNYMQNDLIFEFREAAR